MATTDKITEKIECAVIGAGVIGLAVARALALQGREVIILESADAIGTGTSSRNSEVIHAGIYYDTGSLKAKLCVQGKLALYEYCESHGVAHQRCGKMIVAAHDGQLEKLKALQQKAADNDVNDLIWQDQQTTLEMEPDLKAVASLLSPSTGLIDSHALMLAYQGDAEAAGTMIAFNSPVLGGAITDNSIRLDIGGDAPMALDCEAVINSAGLHAQRVAGSIAGFPAEMVPGTFYAKGNYFSLAGKSPFSHLIYPIPEEAGLGVHLTLDLGGQARFGPDVEWVDEIDYEVDPARGDKFYAAVRSYWPDLPDNALLPGYSGIRPKLQGPGNPPMDFVFNGPTEHGVQGLVNLFGIESPGLTASLAIADEAIKRLK
ncbi:MAG: NAD(P)/FAD-dependent oxidoreductase [Rhodospirillaceae bacterium]|nr:NAD(P)/FAD-dependent oxidoreductase [Rhodospirillaceae bacterium]